MSHIAVDLKVIEQRAADAATGQTSTALDLLDDCRGALVACQARGGGR